MNELALFAGAGGGILGGMLSGFRCVCAVEIDEYCRSILIARQNDRTLDPFPIWDDVRTFSGKPWRGVVDVVSGGFPCQDISAAGKGEGIEGQKSGLWVEMARIIGEVQPSYVFVENSPVLTSRGLGRVLGDLAAMGFDARWGVIGAADVGAPHLRERIWIVANASSGRCSEPKGREIQQSGRAETKRTSNAADSLCIERRQGGAGGACGCGQWHEGLSRQEVPYTDVKRLEGTELQRKRISVGSWPVNGCWWATEPDVGRVADGVAHRVDRIKALGNGQVPAVAAIAWEVLSRK